MNRTIGLAAALAAGLALPASAATFTGGWTVDYNAFDPGLVVEVTPGSGGGTTPDLAVGDSYTFDLFRIWTDETSVNAGEDTTPAPISVGFTFTNPVAGGVIAGVTEGGRSGFFGAVHDGRVTWDAPLTVRFGAGDTGRLTLSLGDATFNRSVFGLHEGERYGASVTATLRYDAAPAPVPLPAALPLMAVGLGALGIAGRRRGRKGHGGGAAIAGLTAS